VCGVVGGVRKSAWSVKGTIAAKKRVRGRGFTRVVATVPSRLPHAGVRL
jgi:hypothetical protein